jgi:hypothetical protein
MVHDQDAALTERYLMHVRVEKRLASRTVALSGAGWRKCMPMAAVVGASL